MLELVCGAYVVRKRNTKSAVWQQFGLRATRKASLVIKNRTNRYVKCAVKVCKPKEVTQQIYFNI